MKKILKLLLFLFSLNLLFAIRPVSAQSQSDVSIIRGVITDTSGHPVANATVVVIDWYFQRALPPLKTNSTGNYEIEVKGGFPHTYRIYAYLMDGSRIMAPSTIEKDFAPMIGETTNVDLTLTPGAILNLTGEIWNVFTGRYSLSLKAQVLDASSHELLTSRINPKVGDYTPFYGDNITSIFVNPTWMSPLDAVHPWIVVIIPANIQTEIKVVASQPGAADQIFLVRNGSEPFYLHENSLAVVNLAEFAYKWSLSAVQKASEIMWANIREAERYGFFLESLKDISMKEVDAQIDLASRSIMKGRFTVKDVQMPLSRAYLFATRYVNSELEQIKKTAEEGALTLPFFLSAFSIVLAFFFFEKNKYRLPSFIAISMIHLIAFYFLYPGVPLILNLYSGKFWEAVLGSLAVGAFIILILPRVISESGNPVKVGLRSALAVAFMIGKRQVKRARFRSILVITSLCILISAFTTLTTVQSFFGLNSETLGNSTGEWALIKAPIEDGETFTPIDVLTLRSIEEEQKIQYTSPKAETLPPKIPGQYIIELKSGTRSLRMLGIIGIIPELEQKYIGLKVVKGTFIKEEGFLMVSQDVANRLGLREGSDIYMRLSSGGVVHEIPMKVSGIFDDDDFNNKKDLNGDFYTPKTLINDKITRCNASQVVLMHFDDSLKLSQDPYKLPIAISRIIVKFENPDDKEYIDSFVQVQAWARGFNVWLSSGGHLVHYFLGTRFEMRYYDLLVPLAISMLSVTAVMYGAVERRQKEIFVYSTVGFNPLHIALVFIAESATMGIVGGGLGYLTGLSIFRALKFLSESISFGVSENLKWWMSVVGVITGMVITIVSAIPPALKAAELAAPSVWRKIKRSPEEEIRRYEEMYKAFGERRVSMPIRVKGGESLILCNYLYDRLNQYTGGLSERIEDLGKPEEKEMPDGSEIISIPFRYILKHRNQWFSTSNIVEFIRKANEDYYRIYFSSKVEQEGMPEIVRERIMKTIYNLLIDWIRVKDKLLKAARKL